MRELSLFSGAGLGVYGTGLDTVLYCEINDYCRRVLTARMADGVLPAAPIWPDVKTLDASSLAVDIVTGGFPCQAFSTASRGRAVAENLWPEMLRVIDQTIAPHVFAENVLRDPIEHAAADLHARGYRAKFARLDASAFGAPHHRPRWWLVAHAYTQGESRCPVDAEVAGVCALAGHDPWSDPPCRLGVLDGDPHRMDRLAALGNAQVPIVARAALAYLW